MFFYIEEIKNQKTPDCALEEEHVITQYEYGHFKSSTDDLEEEKPVNTLILRFQTEKIQFCYLIQSIFYYCTTCQLRQPL